MVVKCRPAMIFVPTSPANDVAASRTFRLLNAEQTFQNLIRVDPMSAQVQTPRLDFTFETGEAGTKEALPWLTHSLWAVTTRAPHHINLRALQLPDDYCCCRGQGLKFPG